MSKTFHWQGNPDCILESCLQVQLDRVGIRYAPMLRKQEYLFWVVLKREREKIMHENK
jgi:hypothetical protein